MTSLYLFSLYRVLLYCCARQRGPQWAPALKTGCPNLKRVISFIVKVERERDQLVDILLMAWW